jgi:hypothetical protein
MKLLLLVILAIAMTSCASTNRRPYKYNNLDIKVVSYYNAAENTATYYMSYKNGVLKYQELVTKGQINSNVDWSCMSDPKSINYVKMNPSDIKYFRTFDQNNTKTVTYKKINQNYNGEHIKTYTEKISDTVKITAKSCWMKKAGFAYHVISETYN